MKCGKLLLCQFDMIQLNTSRHKRRSGVGVSRKGAHNNARGGIIDKGHTCVHVHM